MNTQEKSKVIEVGTGATLVLPSDRYPYVVTKVSKNGRKLTLAALSTEGIMPAHKNGGFPVYDHVYSGDEIANRQMDNQVICAYVDKRGRYFSSDSPVRIGEARYYRDFSD